MLMAYISDKINSSRKAVQVCHNDKSCIWIKLKRSLESTRIHIPRSFVSVDKYRTATLINYGICRSGKGHIRAEHSSALERTVSQKRLSVKLLAC